MDLRGLEPRTDRLWAGCSNQLSYRSKKADERTRTVNLLITNQLLCQLSHIGMSLLSCFLFHFLLSLMTPRGFEPLLPPWKGGVLTAWPWSLISSLFTSLYNKNSPSRARTYNPSVNSRVLCHWAIEDYFFFLFLFWLYIQNCTPTNLPISFLPWITFPQIPSLWLSPRPISISQLHVLPRFHLWPINLVVFKGSYYLRMGYLILRGASRLDAFSVYPFQTWLLCHAFGNATDTPEVRPSRSSRTKDSSSQISYAHAG